MPPDDTPGDPPGDTPRKSQGTARPPPHDAAASRWGEVSRVVDGALELPPAERPAYVARACAGNADLQREVERFLRAYERVEGPTATGFLAEPAHAFAAPVVADVASRAAGADAAVPARLAAALAGRYEVERELGRGGMAIVYLAYDLRHKRQVAVKVLRPELAAALGAERFLREIETAAGLQHPHILALYDSGEAADLLYYVMPHVEGESLRARLERERQLPVDEAVTLIRALAGALDYAHRQGIVHRDVKPENVLLSEGQPLLADFGIALALSGTGGSRLTETGISVGTPQYMSPEQAAGDRAVGPHSDIYALGAVAYELLAGEPPFTGATAEAVLARVLVDEPRPMRTVRRTVPAAVEAAVLKALAKVPADRFRSAAEFAAALGNSATAEPAVAVAGSSQRTGMRRATRAIAGELAALTAVASAATLFVFTRPAVAPNHSPPAVRRQLTFEDPAFVVHAAISPDGQFVAYSLDGNRVLVQDLVGGAPDTVYRGAWSLDGRRFSDTTLSMMSTLEWSPDGTRLLLGYRGRALVVRRTGGPPVGVAAAARLAGPVHAYWLPDGRRVSLHAEDDRRVLAVDLETGDTVAVPVGGRYDLLLGGSWSPDGRLFAVASATGDPLAYAIRAVTLDGHTEVVAEDSVPLDSPRWAPDGGTMYYLRGSGGTSSLRRVRVSPRTGRPRGVPEDVQAQLEVLPLRTNSSGAFSLTRDGRRMVFARGNWMSFFGEYVKQSPERLRQTKRLFPQALTPEWLIQGYPITFSTPQRWSPTVSPDGRWIAFAQQTRDGVELFRIPVQKYVVTGVGTQLTVGARVWPQVPIAWSPDGKRLAFASVRGGRGQVWAADVEGGRLEAFGASRVEPFAGALAWAPGARIAYRRSGGDVDPVDLLDPATGQVRSVRLGSAPGGPVDLRFAPDGHRLAVAWGRRRGRDAGVYVLDLRDSSFTNVYPRADAWVVGWSADGRYVEVGHHRVPEWGASAVYRIDTRRQRAPELLGGTYGHPELTPAGPLHPDRFIGDSPQLESNVWMIENFDGSTP